MFYIALKKYDLLISRVMRKVESILFEAWPKLATKSYFIINLEAYLQIF